MTDSLSIPQPSKRARTRARLLDAAASVFAAKGFHEATLEDVAAAAGMTKGAIYGNFRSKEELFLAVFEKPTFGVRPVFKAGGTLKEQMRRMGEAVVAFLPIAEQRGVLFTEIQRYAQTHPEFRAQADRRTAELTQKHAERFRPFFDEAELGMPLTQFIVILDALIDGLIAQRFLTPSLVTNETIVAAFEKLA